MTSYQHKVKLWALANFAVISVLGSLLHFLYDWTHCPFLALFSAVNESTWEHMKIFFFPAFFFAIAEYFFFGKNLPAFWCVKARSILLGTALIPVLFYTIRGAFGITPDWVNISLFFVVAAIVSFYEAKRFTNPLPRKNGEWAILTLCVLAFVFCLFTFITPRLPLFQDPIDKSFGIRAS